MKTKTTVRQCIFNLLCKVGKPLDAKTIARRGKMNYNTVRKELGALMNDLQVYPYTISGATTKYYA